MFFTLTLRVKEDFAMSNTIRGGMREVVPRQRFEIAGVKQHTHTDVVVVQEVVEGVEFAISLDKTLRGREGWIIFRELDVVLGGQREQDLRSQGSFEMEMVLAFRKTLKEWVEVRFAHFDVFC